MTQQPITIDGPALEAAETIRRNADIRRRIDAEDAAAKTILTALLHDNDLAVSPTGEPLVRVRPGNKVWNEAEARKNLPADVLAKITRVVTEEKVDKELAKAILPPALYELGCKQNKSSVVPA